MSNYPDTWNSDGTFSPDNWGDELLIKARSVFRDLWNGDLLWIEVRNPNYQRIMLDLKWGNDQSYLFLWPETDLYNDPLMVSWYKNRGRTEAARHLLTDDPVTYKELSTLVSIAEEFIQSQGK